MSGVLDLSLATVAALVAASFAAGLVDAIAGGGGLITLPALLAAGLPPHEALGTNKGQSVFGSFAALLRYRRAGLVDPARARLTFPAGFLGAMAGAGLVLLLNPAVLRPLVLVLLVGAAAFIALRAPAADPRGAPAPPRAVRAGVPLAIAAVIGTYDGFFGPGTGTFLVVAFVSLLGQALPQATADAKVVNFASNLASVFVFSYRGVVLWPVAIPMALGQFAGGWMGAHLAVRGGGPLIRKVVLAVVLALVARLGYDMWVSR